MRYKYNGSANISDAELTIRDRMEAFDRLPVHIRKVLREGVDDIPVEQVQSTTVRSIVAPTLRGVG